MVFAQDFSGCLPVATFSASSLFGGKPAQGLGPVRAVLHRPTDPEATQGLSVQESIEGREDIHNHVVPCEARYRPFEKGHRAWCAVPLFIYISLSARIALCKTLLPNQEDSPGLSHFLRSRLLQHVLLIAYIDSIGCLGCGAPSPAGSGREIALIAIMVQEHSMQPLSSSQVCSFLRQL